MKSWYNISAFEVVQGLNSHIKKGLSKESMKKNKELYGDNIIIIPKPRGLFKIVMEEVITPWSILTIFLLGFCIYDRTWYIGSFIGVFFLFIIISLIYYRSKSENKSSAVETLNSQKVQVVREGVYCTVDSNNLVVGDIVIVEKQMYVPADMRIIQCENLKVNELAVTGKNYVCEKFSARISEREINIEEASNMLFKSSVIIDGQGIGVVVAVGMNTEVGGLIRAENKIENNRDMFKTIKGTLNKFSLVAVVVSLGIYIGGIAMGKDRQFTMAVVKQTLLCIMPLVAVVEALLFIVFFLRYIRKKKIYINNISVLEKFKNLQSIFMEKHNVLTENDYKITMISVDNMGLKFHNKNFLHIEKHYGNNKVIEESISIENCHTLKRFIDTILLCNNAVCKEESHEYRGDKKEIAFLKFVENLWTNYSTNKKEHSRVLEVPMDGDTMIRMSINSVDNRFRASAIGPFDNIMERCTHVLRNDIEVELKGDELEKVREMAYDIAISGAEVLAVAYRNFNYRPSLKENIQSNLVLVGLAGCESPIKDDAYNLSAFTASTGMDAIVFTDENKLSTKFFGKHIGVLQEYNNVYSGVELKFMTEDEIKNVENHEVMFSNLDEDQKINIIKEHKKNRGMVAAIACKLTSVPHLCEADVSISHGKDVSGIVKKLSDIYMEDVSVSSLSSIISESTNLLSTYKMLIDNGLFSSIIMTVSIIMAFFFENKVLFNDIWIMLLTVMATTLSGIITIWRWRKNVFRGGLEEQFSGYIWRREEYEQKSSIKKAMICGIVIYGGHLLLQSETIRSYVDHYAIFGIPMSRGIYYIIIAMVIVLKGFRCRHKYN